MAASAYYRMCFEDWMFLELLHRDTQVLSLVYRKAAGDSNQEGQMKTRSIEASVRDRTWLPAVIHVGPQCIWFQISSHWERPWNSTGKESVLYAISQHGIKRQITILAIQQLKFLLEPSWANNEAEEVRSQTLDGKQSGLGGHRQPPAGKDAEEWAKGGVRGELFPCPQNKQ